MKHMTENKLFSESQYGFRNRRSCVLQLLEVLDYLSKSLDEGKQVDTIYLDIRKAFESISHRRLIQKLESYGIEGEVLEWVRDFIKGRRHRVMLDGKSSEWKDVTSGVPQGSVLGPVLFIIYINDMPDKLRKFCKMFADDAKCRFSAIETRNDQHELQEDLFDSCEWGKDWLLEHNIKKCKCIQYGNVKYEFEYKMTNKDNEVISITNESEEKDLGIMFEENLKCHKHITMTVKRANKLVGLIKRTFSFMDKELFLMVYKSLIRSVLDYGSPVWNPSTKKNRQLLENVQRRATKLVPELKVLSYQERFFRQQTFPLRWIDDWNMLPEYVVECETVLSFKTQLDKLWNGRRFDLDQVY